jgi:hypothetical protein
MTDLESYGVPHRIEDDGAETPSIDDCEEARSEKESAHPLPLIEVSIEVSLSARSVHRDANHIRMAGCILSSMQRDSLPSP